MSVILEYRFALIHVLFRLKFVSCVDKVVFLPVSLFLWVVALLKIRGILCCQCAVETVWFYRIDEIHFMSFSSAVLVFVMFEVLNCILFTVDNATCQFTVFSNVLPVQDVFGLPM